MKKKTTLEIEDELFHEARIYAAVTRSTIGEVVSNALHEYLEKHRIKEVKALVVGKEKKNA